MNQLGRPAAKKHGVEEGLPTGEVTEGNADSDWAAWEDSVAFQDSLMPDLQGTVSTWQDRISEPTPQTRSARQPAIEVIEGNAESDWAAWEDSVAFQDSLMPEIMAMATSSIQDSEGFGVVSTEHIDIFS